MTKKHFQMIADALAAKRPHPITDTANSYSQWERDVNAIAFCLNRINPRFDYGKFYRACGMKWEE